MFLVSLFFLMLSDSDSQSSLYIRIIGGAFLKYAYLGIKFKDSVSSSGVGPPLFS